MGKSIRKPNGAVVTSDARAEDLHTFVVLHNRGKAEVPYALILSGVGIAAVGVYAALGVGESGSLAPTMRELRTALHMSINQWWDAYRLLRRAGWVQRIQAAFDPRFGIKKERGPGLIWLAAYPGEQPHPAQIEAMRRRQLVIDATAHDRSIAKAISGGKGVRANLRAAFQPFGFVPTVSALLDRRRKYYPAFDARHPDYALLTTDAVEKLKLAWEQCEGHPYAPIPDYDALGDMHAMGAQISGFSLGEVKTTTVDKSSATVPEV
jgi:hypothetical protein